MVHHLWLAQWAERGATNVRARFAARLENDVSRGEDAAQSFLIAQGHERIALVSPYGRARHAFVLVDVRSAEVDGEKIDPFLFHAFGDGFEDSRHDVAMRLRRSMELLEVAAEHAVLPCDGVLRRLLVPGDIRRIEERSPLFHDERRVLFDLRAEDVEDVLSDEAAIICRQDHPFVRIGNP